MIALRDNNDINVRGEERKEKRERHGRKRTNAVFKELRRPP